VSALLDAGVDAIGLSGEDGALVTARVAAAGELGRVGHVSCVRSELLLWLLERALLPVISPISRGEEGGALNVNADEVAAAVAASLDAPELLFVTDVDGVRDGDGVRRTELTAVEARALVETGAATGGMAVKLEAALEALKTIAAVRIGRFDTMHDNDAGTRIRTEREAALW
jgi:acetylglutamate kinase